MKTISGHIYHYVPLLGIFLAGLTVFVSFYYDVKFQLAAAIAVSIAYVVWGVVHHYLHRDLYWEVVFEYVIYAAVGLLILTSIIFRI